MHSVTKRIATILDKFTVGEARTVLDELAAYIAGRAREAPLLAANVTPKMVWKLLKSKCLEVGRREEGAGAGFNPLMCANVDAIAEGLDAVEFTLENGECDPDSPGSEHWGTLIGPRRFGKLAGVGCYGGGDWEYPIFFVVYLDADRKTLRSYVPKDGNVWNYTTKAAFGNNEEIDTTVLANWLRQNKSDVKFDEDRLDPASDARVMFDEEKILGDIEKHISVAMI